MIKRPFWMLPIALMAAMAMVLGACGDDDAADVASDDSKTDDSKDDDATSDDDSDGDGIGTFSGECGFFAEFGDEDFLSGFDPTGLGEDGPVDFGEFYEPLAAQMRELADNAPSDIEDAFQTLADSFETVAEKLKGVDLDFSDPANMDPKALEAFSSLETTFDDEFEAASAEIEAWVSANCGIDVNG